MSSITPAVLPVDSSSLSPPTSTTSSLAPITSITSGLPTGQLPNGVRLIERTMKDAAWPSELILDLAKSNWADWEHMLLLSVRQCGIRPWLDGDIPVRTLLSLRMPIMSGDITMIHLWRS